MDGNGLSRRDLLLAWRRGLRSASPPPEPEPALPGPAPPRPEARKPSPRLPRRDDAALVAVIDSPWCLAHSGIPCRSCVDVCPSPGALALARGDSVYIPVVDAVHCTACGECERSCPTQPAAIYLASRTQ